MKVRVKLYGPLKKYAESDSFEMDLPDGSRASAVLDRLGVEDRVYLVILADNARVEEDEVLTDGCEVGLLSPIGGGSGPAEPEVTLVRGGTVVTLGLGNQVIEGGAALVRAGRIAAVGPESRVRADISQSEKVRTVDARGGLIMPGMTNAHMHLYSTFARGMALKDPPPKTFGQILERLWWRLDKVLTPEDIYYSALFPLIDGLKAGTTAVIDHHASPGAVDGSLDEVARAVEEVGVRASLCYEVSDRDGPQVARAGIRENARFLRRCRVSQATPNPSGAGAAPDEGAEASLLSASFGLHASLTLSDATLAECREAAAEFNSGFHIHVAEGPEDVADSLKKCGRRVVERLALAGILGPKTVAAHCVHVTAEEMELLARTGTNVVHNPESNMGNAVGCAPVIEMLRRGVNVGLGTDGFTADLFESLKAANVLHKHQAADPGAAWGEVERMVTINNPEIFRAFFPHPLGALEPGAYADIITLDYYPPTPLEAGNLWGHVLFGLSGGKVRHALVGGRHVLENGACPGIDEEKLAFRSRELARKLWERF